MDFSNFGKMSISQLLGSQPVNSIVSFTGVPLNSSLGLADTLVDSRERDDRRQVLHHAFPSKGFHSAPVRT